MSIAIAIGVQLGQTGGAGGSALEDEVLVGAGNRLSAIGASTVQAIGVPGIVEGDGFMHYVWYGGDALGRWQYHPPEGTAGQGLAATLAEVPDYDDHTASYGHLPTHAVVLCGANDMDAATAGAGVIATLTTYESILDGLLERGILPICVAIPPADTTDQMAARARYNTGIALMAAKKGLAFIDPTSTVIDETDGTLGATADSGDGLHFTAAGAKLYGDAIAVKLATANYLVPWDAPLIKANDTNTGAAYKLANGLLLTDTGSDGSPDGWTITSNPNTELTMALEDGGADISGNWMKLTKAATTADGVAQATISSPTVGNWYAVGFAYKWDYLSGSASSIKAEIRNQAGTNIFRVHVKADADVGPAVAWNVFQVPAASTSLQFRVLMNAVGDFYFGQPTVIDLTAQGLDGWL